MLGLHTILLTFYYLPRTSKYSYVPRDWNILRHQFKPFIVGKYCRYIWHMVWIHCCIFSCLVTTYKHPTFTTLQYITLQQKEAHLVHFVQSSHAQYSRRMLQQVPTRLKPYTIARLKLDVTQDYAFAQARIRYDEPGKHKKKTSCKTVFFVQAGDIYWFDINFSGVLCDS